jgi:uncharacterized membrane protein YphA (DoxX/SURF4 family)
MNILNIGFQYLGHTHPALALVVFGIPPDVFWPFFTFFVLFVIGLTKILAGEISQRRGIDKLLPFGRLFYVIPMAVFGTDHFVDIKGVARIVPKWMPFHVFWTWLVGIALVAAALAIILKIQGRLAAILLGCMFLLFVALIHVHNIQATHGARLFWMIALRETTFSGGAFAVASLLSKRTPSEGTPWLVTLCRFLVGIPAIIFGVEHFLHPLSEPGVPLEKMTPAWVPAPALWAYLFGAALIICGACIVANVKARPAAMVMGVVILFLVVILYVPITIKNPSDIDSGLNSLVDTLAFSGTFLVLADAMGRRNGREVGA